jgi:hypothetical protein
MKPLKGHNLINSIGKVLCKRSKISVPFNLNRIRTFERRRKGKRPVSDLGAAQSRPENRGTSTARLQLPLHCQSAEVQFQHGESILSTQIAKIGRPERITAEVSSYIDTLSS